MHDQYCFRWILFAGLQSVRVRKKAINVYVIKAINVFERYTAIVKEVKDMLLVNRGNGDLYRRRH